MMNTATKTERLVDALYNGEEFTAKQAVQRFGFTSTHAVRATVSKLRLNEGLAVYCNRRIDTKGRVKNKYRLGIPSRTVVAAGYRALNYGIV